MLVCKKIGSLEAGLGSQAAAEAPGAAGLSAGRGLRQRGAEGLGGDGTGRGAGMEPEITFSGQSAHGSVTPCQSFYLHGMADSISQGLFYLTLTSSSTLIKA